MIAVIADDITGGAEIAGTGFRYGLRVELSTRSDISRPDADLWVVSTDSRSMCVKDAEKITYHTVSTLTAGGIESIFKKTDSVLRGHVMAELAAQLKAESKNKVVLCPANPASGRKIINGIYYIDGIPLHQTSFSNDPDFPVTSSNVKEILLKHLTVDSNITIADAASKDDLKCAARLKNHETILAGSAAFFSAFLESMGYQPLTDKTAIPELKNALFVRGSAFARSRDEVKNTAASSSYVTYLSPLIINASDYQRKLDNYASEMISVLKKGENAIVAIGEPVLQGKKAADKIKNLMSEVVRNVLTEVNINELVIEGGATTAAILSKLNYTQFEPTFEFAPGVVRMKIRNKSNMYITIKPGSYQFPEQVWDFKK
jgi:D-threonate/D-erythronate kinase